MFHPIQTSAFATSTTAQHSPTTQKYKGAVIRALAAMVFTICIRLGQMSIDESKGADRS
jgi:hypothetical protein